MYVRVLACVCVCVSVAVPVPAGKGGLFREFGRWWGDTDGSECLACLCRDMLVVVVVVVVVVVAAILLTEWQHENAQLLCTFLPEWSGGLVVTTKQRDNYQRSHQRTASLPHGQHTCLFVEVQCARPAGCCHTCFDDGTLISRRSR